MSTGSFRVRLTLRFTALMAALFILVGVVAVALLRQLLTSEFDGTLVRLAAIEASALSDAHSPSELHFHEGTFDPPRSEGLVELVRYAEIRRPDGGVVVRSRSLGVRDLPFQAPDLSTARKDQIVVGTVRWNEQVLRAVVYPLAPFGAVGEGYVLQVAASSEPVTRVLAVLVRFLVGLGMSATVLTFVGGWVLAARAIRPAREIAEQAEAITAGSLAARIHAHADASEYQRLVAVLNAMLERLEAAFDAQRRFVADASHEIRHPLAVLRAGLELALRRERATAEYRDALADGLAQAERVSVLAEDLLLLARSDAGVLQPRREPCEMWAVVRAACGRSRLVAEVRDVRVEVVASKVSGAISSEDDERREPVAATVDVALVDRALDILLDNAIKFSPSGGAVQIELEHDARAVCLHVIDAGAGVAPEHQSRLFDRFFRGDAARVTGSGAGLGLAIARGIAEAHGGTVAYEPGSLGGSRFTLRLPR